MHDKTRSTGKSYFLDHFLIFLMNDNNSGLIVKPNAFPLDIKDLYTTFRLWYLMRLAAFMDVSYLLCSVAAEENGHSIRKSYILRILDYMRKSCYASQ